MLTAAAYDIHLEQLLDRIKHLSERDPLRARLTKDADAAIVRAGLPRVIEAARQAGLEYRHAAGVDSDLVRMKLTSFRLEDRVHIQDPDAVGLISPEIETGLSETLRSRLAEVRASD